MTITQIGIAFTLCSALGIGVLMINNSNSNDAQEEIVHNIHQLMRSNMESAYMDGQIDALQGKVRITETDSNWFYNISPWDDENDITKVQFMSKAK